jgi:predicted Fe-Mo cluster-binding NifX family protein
MKIAVTYASGLVEQHFGNTTEFKIYTIENGKKTNQEIISTEGYAHGTLFDLLELNKIDTLLCGGLGISAKNIIIQKGIKLIPGVVGKADESVNSFLNDTLVFDPDISCAGHDHK